ncbi:helix-turn-helix transcriptional regulator [Lipingzhangella sp. LS1_29]|uniref:Helix-turn-helix transcriptional regulator n=1 Tax=Lipingzhangella rawalii TaxID=2055835 RepID=A0ABU2H4B3_9ACTN|nr:helix-turn-helix transcriptional regulator [Lipingzhangella rawalii]MDS1269694.1 helix-turn-helix transcriptional regulator [Lipingzhangella rawalii]
MVNPHALRALREKDQQSQVALARATGISPQLLSDIEAGRRSGRLHIRALAQALGVPLSALCYRPENPEETERTAA